MDSKTNIHFASASHENPLFILTSRAPAHVATLESPEEVYDFLMRRFEKYADDPAKAVDFEVVDLIRS